jgi:hypothetical protein
VAVEAGGEVDGIVCRRYAAGESIRGGAVAGGQHDERGDVRHQPGLIYLYGWAGVLGYAVAAPLGIFVGLVVFSKSFRRLGDELRVLTVPQWIGDRSATVAYGVLRVS